jgi:hypothetical protein
VTNGLPPTRDEARWWCFGLPRFLWGRPEKDSLQVSDDARNEAMSYLAPTPTSGPAFRLWTSRLGPVMSLSCAAAVLLIRSLKSSPLFCFLPLFFLIIVSGSSFSRSGSSSESLDSDSAAVPVPTTCGRHSILLSLKLSKSRCSVAPGCASASTPVWPSSE